MDESWRMRIGMPSSQRRRSTEDTSSSPEFSHPKMFLSGDPQSLQPEDFNDVFGGPPRSVLTRKFSGDFTGSEYFYREIFRQQDLPENAMEDGRFGRRLPEFRIPARRRSERWFLGSVFGTTKDDQDWRSRSRSKSKGNSKSKSNSSSVLSSEEISPRQVAVAEEDVDFSYFASRLRPINVPCRWTPSKTIPRTKNNSQYFPELTGYNSDYFTSTSNFGFRQRAPSPEPNINISTSMPTMDEYDVEITNFNSPSSAVSTASPEFEHEDRERGVGEEEDEVMRSYYVIEINSQPCYNETAVDIDEAIAWAKEKFHSCNDQSTSNQETSGTVKQGDQAQANGRNAGEQPLDMDTQKCDMHENNAGSGEEVEIAELDERIRQWSAGKESNMRVLLSTLHHVLWEGSGWVEIPISKLFESKQVKKAYQKARLCIHPDKLQQRGATPPHKYIAQQAFSVLQDAWATFVSQEVSFG